MKWRYLLLDPAPFNFGDQVKGHSAQFRFDYRDCWLFWDTLLETFGILNP